MLLTKLKAVTAVLLAAALAGAGAAVAWAATPGKEGRAPMNADATQAIPADKAPEAAPDPDEKAIREYVAELRATVKNPSDDHAVYRLVIDAKFHKAVHWAARRGDDALVVELIRDYYGPNNPDRGGTALTWAAWINDAEAVQNPARPRGQGGRRQRSRAARPCTRRSAGAWPSRSCWWTRAPTSTPARNPARRR